MLIGRCFFLNKKCIIKYYIIFNCYLFKQHTNMYTEADTAYKVLVLFLTKRASMLEIADCNIFYTSIPLLDKWGIFQRYLNGTCSLMLTINYWTFVWHHTKVVSWNLLKHMFSVSCFRFYFIFIISSFL